MEYIVVCKIILLSMILFLSACAAPLPPAPIVDGWRQHSESSKYRVHADDTVYSIAWMFGMDYRDIVRYNQLSEPYALHSGQELWLTPPSGHQGPKDSHHIPSTQHHPVSQEGEGVTTYAVDLSSPVSEPVIESRSESNVKSSADSSAEPKPSVRAKTAQTSQTTPPQTSKPAVPVEAKTTDTSKTNASGKWLWPAEGEVIKKFSTASGGNRGLDIAGNLRDPIVASAPGKVVYTGSSIPGYGRLIIVKHDNSDLSAYAFNDSILVKEGDAVKRGQKIATMGKNNEGKPSLHFEVRKNGKPQDPLKYLK